MNDPHFLLDTNTCIEYLRQRNSSVLAAMRSCRPDELRVCSIVVAELYYGAINSPRRSENLALLARFLPPLRSLPFDDRAAWEYGAIRADLSKAGVSIGPNDLLIASIAVANGLTLVTHNVAEFSRVAGLALVDWQVH